MYPRQRVFHPAVNAATIGMLFWPPNAPVNRVRPERSLGYEFRGISAPVGPVRLTAGVMETEPAPLAARGW